MSLINAMQLCQFAQLVSILMFKHQLNRFI
jgi:hypothetical protein